MIEFDVQVVGDREVATKIEGMPDSLRERLRALLPQAGEEIRSAAASLAPHSARRSSASKKFGPLRSKIKARFSERRDSFIESVSVGTAFYGKFLERGLDTSRRAARRRGVVGVKLRHLKSGGVSVSARRGLLRRQNGASTSFHLPASPFLGPAFLSRRDSILARIRESVAASAAT